MKPGGGWCLMCPTDQNRLTLSCSLIGCCNPHFSLANLTAAVMISRDVTVHLFSTYVPTPYVVRKQ